MLLLKSVSERVCNWFGDTLHCWWTESLNCFFCSAFGEPLRERPRDGDDQTGPRGCQSLEPPAAGPRAAPGSSIGCVASCVRPGLEEISKTQVSTNTQICTSCTDVASVCFKLSVWCHVLISHRKNQASSEDKPGNYFIWSYLFVVYFSFLFTIVLHILFFFNIFIFSSFEFHLIDF